MDKILHIKTALLTIFLFLSSNTLSAHTIAREWNELLLESIRNDFARPTIHARNLYHSSVLMYDLWAAYDQVSVPFFLGQTVDGFYFQFNGISTTNPVQQQRETAISYGMYRLLVHRFSNSPAASTMLSQYDNFMASLGHNINFTSTDYSNGSAAALGNYLADQIINFGLQDGSNEINGYANTYYSPINPSMVIALPGNPNLVDFNRWQPLSFNFFIDQSGNIFPTNTPDFLSPEWGDVSPFCLSDNDKTVYSRSGNDYQVFHDPGQPPLLDQSTGIGAAYKWGFELVSSWSAHMDSADPTILDISPASIGNISTYPSTFTGMQSFYDFTNGGDASPGHTYSRKCLQSSACHK